MGNTKSNHDILIPFLVTFGLLLLLVIIAVVTWKLWNTHKNSKTKRKEENQSTIVTGREEDNGTYTNVVYRNRSSENPRFTEPDYETAYITVMPPADSGDEVTYSSIVLQHRETGQRAPPSCVDAADAVTYSSVAPQRKHSH